MIRNQPEIDQQSLTTVASKNAAGQRNPANGTLCPECKAWTRVLRTTGAMRQRECANGHRFTTTEQPISKDKPEK
jgi:hypothetical protein